MKILFWNKRRSIALITAIVTLAVYIAGITIAVVHSKKEPEIPQPQIMAVLGEPTYQIAIGWKAVKGAYAYELQCEYAYNDRRVELSTRDTSVRIERIKGELRYRMRTLGRKNQGISGFTEWQTYNVEPYYIDKTPPKWTFTKTESGYRADPKFLDYKFQGKPKQVKYYDYVSVGPTHIKEAQFITDMETIAVSDAYRYRFPFTPGEWTIYYRPSVCIAFMQVQGKIYNDEQMKIYDETEQWQSTTIIVE